MYFETDVLTTTLINLALHFSTSLWKITFGNIYTYLATIIKLLLYSFLYVIKPNFGKSLYPLDVNKSAPLLNNFAFFWGYGILFIVFFLIFAFL